MIEEKAWQLWKQWRQGEQEAGGEVGAGAFREELLFTQRDKFLELLSTRVITSNFDRKDFYWKNESFRKRK